MGSCVPSGAMRHKRSSSTSTGLAMSVGAAGAHTRSPAGRRVCMQEGGHADADGLDDRAPVATFRAMILLPNGAFRTSLESIQELHRA